MIAKYRTTRNKRRHTGRKNRRSSKRSHRFFTRRRKTRNQHGGNFGRTEIAEEAIVYYSPDPNDAEAPRMVRKSDVKEPDIA